MFVFFFFSSRRRHTRFDCDWSSDVCSSDLLSLAIGRNGQNVRLASELTGWKIDLYSSREWLERGGGRPPFAPPPPGGRGGPPQGSRRGVEGPPGRRAGAPGGAGAKTLAGTFRPPGR